MHGNSSSKKVFSNQLNSPELNRYNLISIDLTGHGSSGRLKKDEFYTVDHYAEVLGAFVEKLELKNIIAVGHSLGAHITTKFATLNKTIGLFNIQNTPLDSVSDLDRAISQDTKFSSFFSGSYDESAILKLQQALFTNSKYSKHFLKDFYNTDPKCRDDLLNYIKSNPKLDEISSISNFKHPYALIAGREDFYCNQDYLKSIIALKESLKFIDNSAHFPMLETPKEFNSLLNKFIERCDSTL